MFKNMHLYSSPAQRTYVHLLACLLLWLTTCPPSPCVISVSLKETRALPQSLTTPLCCSCQSFAHPVIPSLWHGPLVSLMSMEQVCKRRAPQPLACLYTSDSGMPDEHTWGWVQSLALWETHSTPWTERVNVNVGSCSWPETRGSQWQVFTGPCLVLALVQHSKGTRRRST